MPVLGEHIRTFRIQRGLTASELARQANVSRSLISQIERGTSSPSVEVLRRIATTLNIHVGALFDGPLAGGESTNDFGPTPSVVSGRVRVVRRDQRKVLYLPASRVRYELLSPDLQGRLEFIRIEVGPGEAAPPVGFSHEGEESWLVVQGMAHFYYGDQLFVLAEGDTITFDSSVPHRVANPEDRPLVAISAGTPPSF